MLSFIKKIFGTKPVETVAEVPYKVEAKPVEDTADIAIAQRPDPVAEAVAQVMVKSIAPAKKPAPKKQQFSKKPAAPKTAKPKAPRKPKPKPVV